MATQAAKDTRLEMRIPSGSKETIEQAALLSGKSVSAYVLSTLLEQARKDIREYETLMLNDEERDRFLNLLTNPPLANDALKNLLKD